MTENINYYQDPFDENRIPTKEEIEEELTRDFEWELYKIERHRLNQERWNRETTNDPNPTEMENGSGSEPCSV
jgi:hypothetical protein